MSDPTQSSYSNGSEEEDSDDAGKTGDYKEEHLGDVKLKEHYWECREDSSGRYLNGKCPHCGHETDVFFPGETYMSYVTAVNVGKEIETECPPARLPMRCACFDSHEPEDEKQGCGRSWEGVW